jgi:hypothetical protein
MVKKNEIVGSVTQGGEENCIINLVRKSEGKRPLGRYKHRWEKNI